MRFRVQNSLKGCFIGDYIRFRVLGLESKLLKGVYIGDYAGSKLL